MFQWRHLIWIVQVKVSLCCIHLMSRALRLISAAIPVMPLKRPFTIHIQTILEILSFVFTGDTIPFSLRCKTNASINLQCKAYHLPSERCPIAIVCNINVICHHYFSITMLVTNTKPCPKKIITCKFERSGLKTLHKSLP